jgi:hypothetical protein
MTSSLLTIQADFQNYVLGARQDTPAIAGSVVEQFGLNAGDRLAIYYNAYRLRICEALSKAYDKTHAYLGDEMFENLCLGYIGRHTSRHSSMRWYGAHFAEYLAQTLEEHPFVAELAAFEWALGLAFDAEDAPVLNAADMGTIAPEQWEHIGFDLHPSIRFLSMHSNAVAIWLALDQQQTPPESAMSEQPVAWLVWRKELQPHFRSLDRHEAQALQGLQQGKSFSAVCEQIMEGAEGDDLMTKVAGWLQTWMIENVLSAVTMQNDASS